MSANGNGYRDNGIVDDQGYQNEYGSNEHFGVDPEKNISKSSGTDDPFGDESKSEVKYRTMAWW